MLFLDVITKEGSCLTAPRTKRRVAEREAVFTDVVEQLHERLLAMAAVITANRAVAEDAVAGAYASTWSRLRRADVAEVDRYLWRAVARQARRLSRLHRRAPALLAQSAPEDPADIVASDAGLAELLARLPLKQRTVTALRYVAGFSEAEVAEILSIPVGTVKSRLSRAAETLRQRELARRGRRPGRGPAGGSEGAKHA